MACLCLLRTQVEQPKYARLARQVMSVAGCDTPRGQRARTTVDVT
jgi:hypothetical protein